MSELIPAGTTATTFAAGEFIVTSGSPRALFIKPNGVDGPAPSGVDFQIAHKGSNGHYHMLDTLNAGNIGSKGLIAAPGTYAVARVASSVSAGMDVEG